MTSVPLIVVIKLDSGLVFLLRIIGLFTLNIGFVSFVGEGIGIIPNIGDELFI